MLNLCTCSTNEEVEKAWLCQNVLVIMQPTYLAGNENKTDI